MFYCAGWHVGGLGLRTHTWAYTYTNVYVCMFRATRHRKVLRDIAPAIRPSFWELNFCGCWLPLSFALLVPFVWPRSLNRFVKQGSNPFDARSPRFFSPLFAQRSPLYLFGDYHQPITSARDLWICHLLAPKQYGDVLNRKKWWCAAILNLCLELCPIQLHRRHCTLKFASITFSRSFFIIHVDSKRLGQFIIFIKKIHN